MQACGATERHVNGAVCSHCLARVSCLVSQRKRGQFTWRGVGGVPARYRRCRASILRFDDASHVEIVYYSLRRSRTCSRKSLPETRRRRL